MAEASQWRKLQLEATPFRLQVPSSDTRIPFSQLMIQGSDFFTEDWPLPFL